MERVVTVSYNPIGVGSESVGSRAMILNNPSM